LNNTGQEDRTGEPWLYGGGICSKTAGRVSGAFIVAVTTISQRAWRRFLVFILSLLSCGRRREGRAVSVVWRIANNMRAGRPSSPSSWTPFSGERGQNLRCACCNFSVWRANLEPGAVNALWRGDAAAAGGRRPRSGAAGAPTPKTSPALPGSGAFRRALAASTTTGARASRHSRKHLLRVSAHSACGTHARRAGAARHRHLAGAATPSLP